MDARIVAREGLQREGPAVARAAEDDVSVERVDQRLLDILCVLLLYDDFGAFEHLWLLRTFHPYILRVGIVLFVFVKCDGVFVRPNGCILGLLLRL